MLQPAKKKKLSEVVATQIIETIQCGIYQKGDLLPPEKDLIQVYKVSRITLRAALKTLAENGVIATKQGVGSFVAIDKDDPRICTLQTGTPNELREIFHYSMEIRKMVEPEVARQVAKMHLNEADLEKVVSAWEKGRMDRGENLIWAFTPDEEFHLEIIRLLKNPILVDWISQLQTLENTTQRVKLPRLENQREFVEENRRKHELILQAIRCGDEESAYFYMKQHLAELSEQFERYFANFHKYQES